MNDMPSASVVPPTSASQIPSFLVLFKEALAFWKANAGFFTLFCLSMVLLVLPLALGLAGFGLSALVLSGSRGAMMGVGILLGIFCFFAFAFLFFGAFVANIAWIHASFEGKALGVVGAWKKALDLNVCLKLFLGGLLWMLMFGIGFLLFILPAIYLMIPFYLWAYVVVRENLGVIESIQRSFELARGFWWTLFVRYGWLIVIAILLQAGLQLFSVLVLVIVGSVSIFAAIAIMSLANIVFSLFAWLVLTPVCAVFYRILYQRLVEVKKQSVIQALSSSEIFQALGIIAMWFIAVGIMMMASLLSPDIENSSFDLDARRPANVYSDSVDESSVRTRRTY